MNKDDFLSLIASKGIDLSSDSFDSLLNFMDYTLSTNEKFNLTAITDKDSFLEKMIYDSLLARIDLDLNNKKAIDVGTGAGYPGMVLGLSSSVDITLLDSTNKKINYLNEYIEKNNLKNIHTICSRAEDYSLNNREKYDYAFARAVASLPILLEIIIPLLKVNGTFVALKGPGAIEEINQSENALKKLNAHVEKIIEEELYDSKEKRFIIHIKKDKATNKKYPRPYLAIKKQPL